MEVLAGYRTLPYIYKFGNAFAAFTVNSDTEIVAVSPNGVGAVNITVVTTGGASIASSVSQFTYGK